MSSSAVQSTNSNVQQSLSSSAPLSPARSVQLSLNRSAALCQESNARKFMKLSAVLEEGIAIEGQAVLGDTVLKRE